MREREREIEVWNTKWVGDGHEEKLIVRLRGGGMLVMERKSEGGKGCLS